MQIPLPYVDVVIGTNGANINYCQKNSGVIITIDKIRGVPREILVEIHRTASQVNMTQQLLQVSLWDLMSVVLSQMLRLRLIRYI